GQVLVNAAKQSSAASTSTARPKVNTVAIRPNVNAKSSYFKPHFPKRRHFNQRSATKTNTFLRKVNTAKGKNVTTVGPKAVVNAANGKKENGNPQYTLQDQGIFDSGCSRCMTGNKSFLTEYQEINGGFVAFGGSPKGGKSTEKDLYPGSVKSRRWLQTSQLRLSMLLLQVVVDGAAMYILLLLVTIKTAKFLLLIIFTTAGTINNATVKVKKVNDQEQIQALVDKNKVIITEESIRSNLRFDDVEGTACLLNEEIVEGLARIGTMAYAIICLADNQKLNFLKYICDNMVKSLEGGVKFYLFPRFLKEAEVYNDESEDEDHVPRPSSDPLPSEVYNDESEDEDHVPRPSSDPLPSGEDSFILNELMVFCTSLQEHVLDLQEAKAAQAKEIAALKKKVTKLNKWRKSRSGGLRRLKKFGSGRRVKPPLEKDSLDDETQGRTNDDEIFRVDYLAGEEVVVDTTTGEHEEQIIKDVSTTNHLQEHVLDLQEAKAAQAKEIAALKKKVTKLNKWRKSRSGGLKRLKKFGSVTTTTTTVKDSAAPRTDVIEDEITIAQALAALKSIKPKVVVQEQEMSNTITAAATTVTTVVLTPRAK
nr:hypothetical protein [Tanacetum cinerariifolium]